MFCATITLENRVFHIRHAPVFFRPSWCNSVKWEASRTLFLFLRIWQGLSSFVGIFLFTSIFYIQVYLTKKLNLGHDKRLLKFQTKTVNKQDVKKLKCKLHLKKKKKKGKGCIRFKGHNLLTSALGSDRISFYLGSMFNCIILDQLVNLSKSSFLHQ